MPILPHSFRCSGFTLVEMIISIVLLGILAAMGSSMMVDNFTTARLIATNQTSKDEGRYVLERLAREIREAKYISSAGTGSYCITTLTASQLVFKRMNSGSSDTTTCATESYDVTIGLSGTTLSLASSTSTATLSSQVSSFNLKYYDVNNTETTSTSAVRFVQIELTLQGSTTVGQSTESGQSIVQRTRVALRNSA
jgi:prepilin-type N-terminal cleavage/methylation domain-containing protein